MKVSIIIPTYNRAEYLSKAIESVLAQDYSDIELVVSDNASSDETKAVVKKYLNNKRFRYFRNKENIGMVANWRKALNKYVDGDYFLILSDDDYFIDNSYITKAVKLIKQDPEIVIVYANSYLFHKKSNKMVNLILPHKTIESGKTIFLSRNKIMPLDFCLCNVIFNRSLALKLNAFSNDYNIFCDTELFLKMCLFGKVGVIKEFVSVYQLHSENAISGIKNDLILLINSLDSGIEPYKIAKSLNIFSNQELEDWESRVIIFAIIYVLSMVLIFNKEEYNNMVIKIKNLNTNLLEKAQKTFKFRFIFLLFKLRLIGLTFKIQKKIDEIRFLY